MRFMKNYKHERAEIWGGEVRGIAKDLQMVYTSNFMNNWKVIDNFPVFLGLKFAFMINCIT